MNHNIRFFNTYLYLMYIYAGQLKVFREELKTLRGQLKTFRGEIKTLREQLKTFRGELKTFRGELKTFYGKLKTLRGQLKTFCEEFKVFNSPQRVYLLMMVMANRSREGHSAMVTAWRSADVAACRAVSNPAWCRIFREIS